MAGSGPLLSIVACCHVLGPAKSMAFLFTSQLRSFFLTSSLRGHAVNSSSLHKRMWKPNEVVAAMPAVSWWKELDSEFGVLTQGSCSEPPRLTVYRDQMCPAPENLLMLSLQVCVPFCALHGAAAGTGQAPACVLILWSSVEQGA